MKLDIKSWLIIILLGAFLIFFGLWYFGNTDYKNRNKILESENKKIEMSRDSLKRANEVLETSFTSSQKDIDNLKSRQKQIETDLEKARQYSSYLNTQLGKQQKDLDDTKKKIEDLKKNPLKRENNDLINSLKEKLK